ncbi:MAG: hypothetical protein WC960_06905 [Bacteroidales bacterium]
MDRALLFIFLSAQLLFGCQKGENPPFDSQQPTIVTTTLPSNQNSFMVQPPRFDGKIYRYLIPIDRVNQFWNSPYAHNEGAPISETTNWVAEVIWKDFDLSQTLNIFKLSEGLTQGRGGNGVIGFEICDSPLEIYGVFTGNVLIGIKRADSQYRPTGEYLWSWHIWLTDWDGTLQDYSNGRGYQLMDRNLGAKASGRGDVGSLGLYYQWGRKDPFISASDIAFFDGETVSYAHPAEAHPTVVPFTIGGTVSYSVKHPTTFVCSTVNGVENSYRADWLKEPIASLWMESEKSIFDPCPQGFKVANRYSWAGLNSENFQFDYFNRGRGNNLVWYPAAGCIRGEVGELRYVGTHGYSIWIATSNISTSSSGVKSYYARNLWFTHTTLTVDYSASRAHGATVRCMKWDEV